ncbi:response regulator [Haliangium ochraceum]|uniref:Response regulator receiver protein n=1 Tax=Haliangium ochraceum (strain DSM 14365 / JCM 11303 / SMP-2) TaxID=502025 RepID=D0LYZ3_HALO1|nr:response regulator [Haliangium ochraceum]ACY14463.1 response regulator receiver protein [Haliangium ochraceum DSM 14365]
MARILIVDDEPFVRNALCRVLNGYELSTAANGEEALSQLSADELSFDLILCDLMMPGVSGMDIYEFLKRRQPGREMQLMFLTGGVFTEEAQAFVANIPNPVIQKPFKFDQLRNLIKAKLAAASPSDAL